MTTKILIACLFSPIFPLFFCYGLSSKSKFITGQLWPQRLWFNPINPRSAGSLDLNPGFETWDVKQKRSLSQERFLRKENEDSGLFYDSDIYLLLNPAAYERRNQVKDESFPPSLQERKEKVAGHPANYL